ncbi:MAG: periplasmic heavy metal sensor [Roseitalea sp.]|jgi:Spy/CpxP family protein refolding chaperone|nr:periplasmic heavy metal sensor [Roseitalea sp.]MBO6721707.1 periplasmic heavy metal sensor [Roseitalea sp.]MBO6743504.1 periplasmic heavy metal sensor [Roseitalea sp.]
MTRSIFSAIIALVVGIGVGLIVQPLLVSSVYGSNTHQPYHGQDSRTISSLSPDDIRQIEAGEGWGLAKPAELNGYPGPAHVLELTDELALEPGQQQAIQASFDAMKTDAKALGAQLIAAEAALDIAFRSGAMPPGRLRELLEEAENARVALRQVHLSAHLDITPLLTVDQKAQYAALRGYGDGRHGHGGH